MKRLAPLGLALLLAACGAQEPGPAGPQPGPYSQDATVACLEDAGYSFEIGHGDPPSMRAQDIVFSIWLDDIGEIDFFHPSAEVTTVGEHYDNAGVRFEENVSPEERDAIIGCLR
jgi:hypothetical protein